MLITQSAASIAESLLAEFETQAPITRRFLERLPEDKLGWKPHPKSMTAGQLAYHLAFVPGGVVRFVQNNPAQAPESFDFPQPLSRQEILDRFDETIQIVRETLPLFDDAAMAETWRLISGAKVVLAQPRGLFLRDVMLSHWYQHRGQFCVYLRLLNIAVPASWGPSADEPPPFMQNVQQA
ncbi:MAG: DinB family protein [Silvibacterium sp.]|nr:DinB family protein [Silvibacterium sp.]